jgi:hypothetical protein
MRECLLHPSGSQESCSTYWPLGPLLQQALLHPSGVMECVTMSHYVALCKNLHNAT